jgi:hypothetical protein
MGMAVWLIAKDFDPVPTLRREIGAIVIPGPSCP